LKPTCVIHGAASGADTLADEWAKGKGIYVSAYPANWKLYGKSAGPIRNQQMMDTEHPDLVVAFSGGRGTAHMSRIARKAGVTVLEIKPCPKL
jgi:cysteine synthase